MNLNYKLFVFKYVMFFVTRSVVTTTIQPFKQDGAGMEINDSNINAYQLEQVSHIKRQDENLTLKWLSSLFDHIEWNVNNFKLRNKKCEMELNEYVMELKNGTIWATKMSDASGKYGGELFFGNDFWIGSHSLCKELQDPAHNEVIPPFQLLFNVARVQLYLKEMRPAPKVILAGQCLPASCDVEAVSAILSYSDLTFAAGQVHSSSSSSLYNKSDNFTDNTLKVLVVRPVPGPYSIWNDKKFYIVGGVALVTFALILLSSLYESCLKVRRKKIILKDIEIANNNTPNVNDETAQCAKEKMRTNSDTLSQLLLSFSALSNGYKILATEPLPEDSIPVVHGLRFLSLGWIIMVHTYLQLFAVADNKALRAVIERNYLYQTVGNATFSVDTFFFISGLLVTILYYRSLKRSNVKPLKNKSKLKLFVTSTTKFLSLLFYRVARLTPAYLFVIGLNEIALRYSYNNSVFEPAIIDHITCDLYWWRNVLYINNMYPQTEMCMVWSWYMANDTQFYIVGVILLLFSVRYFKVSLGVLVFLMITSWATAAYISYSLQYLARISEPFEMFDHLYDKPWSRIGPYLVGMMTGWLLFKTDSKIRLPIWSVVLGWSISLTILWSLVYGMKDGQLGIFTTAAYVSIGHTAWAAAIAWITIACCTGHGGFVSTVLSYRGILPLSRLTYCAYLVHPMIMMLSSFQMDGPFHLHNGMVIIMFMGNAVASFLASFVISLAFEAPVVRLLKILFGSRKKNV